MANIGIYKRKLAKGTFWYFAGQHKGIKYFSKAEYHSKPDCRKAEAERIKNIEKEVKRPTEKMSLLELCNARLDYIMASKSKSYYKDNHKAFSKLLNSTGNVSSEKVTRAMMHKHFLNESIRLRKGGKGNYQVNADLKMIRALFNYAMNELEVIDNNPTKNIKPYPVKQKLKYIPSDNDIDLVYSLASTSQKSLIVFVKESACRIGEAIRATGDDIDLDMNLLTLWTRKKKNSDLVPRRIPLHPDLKKMGKEGRLFPEWSDRPNFLDKHCKKAGIKPFGWHAFRHRKASIMAQNNVPLIEIMNYLGHENIEVTQNYLRLLGYTKY